MSEQKYSDSLQIQYESLSKSHESLIRSRNQQVREIQESYLAVLKDLENHKTQSQQKRKELEDEIQNLRRQLHENQRSADQKLVDQTDLARQDKEKLEAQIVEEKISKTQLQSIHDQLKIEHEGLSAKAHQLSEKIMRLVSEKQDLETALEAERRQFSAKESDLIAYQTECDELLKKSEEQIATTSEALNQSEKRTEVAKLEIASLERKVAQEIQTIEGLQLSIKELQAEGQTLRAQIAQLQSQEVTLKGVIDQKDKLNAEMNSQISGLRRAMIAEKKISLDLRSQVETLQEKVSEGEASIRDQQAQIQERSDSIQSLSEKNQEQQAEIEILKGQISSSETTRIDLENETTRLKEEILRINGYLEKSNAKNSNLEVEKCDALEKMYEAKELLAGQIKVEQELRSHVLQKQDLLSALSENLNVVTSHNERMRKEISVYEQDQIKSRQKLIELEQTFRASKDAWTDDSNKMKSQIENLRIQLSSENAELIVSRRELAAKKDGIENKEKLLRFYSDSLNSMKALVRDQVTSLLREFELFKAINPMTEYYKMTLREIARTESELRELSVASPTKALLEDCLSDLIEQREFQRAILEKFQQDFDLKIEKISGLISAQAFTLNPPPPPQAQEESEVIHVNN